MKTSLRLKDFGKITLASLIGILPIVSTTSCRGEHKSEMYTPSMNEELSDALNSKLRKGVPSYSLARNWLQGYDLPDTLNPNKFAYFVVVNSGLLGSSRINVRDGESGIRIELDQIAADSAYARAIYPSDRERTFWKQLEDDLKSGKLPPGGY